MPAQQNKKKHSMSYSRKVSSAKHKRITGPDLQENIVLEGMRELSTLQVLIPTLLINLRTGLASTYPYRMAPELGGERLEYISYPRS